VPDRTGSEEISVTAQKEKLEASEEALNEV
jgi:hypothetical protein